MLFDEFGQTKKRARPSVLFDASAAVEASRRLVAELEKTPSPPRKRHSSLLTSFQDTVEYIDEEDDLVDEPVCVINPAYEERNARRAAQMQAVRDAATARAEISKELIEVEEAQTRRWRDWKTRKHDTAFVIELGPTDPSKPRPKRSLFLITVTDNSSIIDPSLDTSELWVSPAFDDLKKAYTEFFSRNRICDILRPGNNIKTQAAAERAITNNVENVLFRVTRERSPVKGQAHIHVLAAVYYYPIDGFYPQINTDNLRRVFRESVQGGGDTEKRFYVNVKYVKDSSYDTKYYLTTPPGDKKKAKQEKKTEVTTPSVVL